MFLLQTPPAPVRAAVERIVAAHAKLTAFEARIDRPGSSPTTIARSGGTVWLRSSDTSGLFPTRRTICAKPAAGWVYDEFLAELVPAQVKGGTPSDRLVSITGTSDDAVRLLLEPTTLAAYLRGLAKSPGAKIAGTLLTFPAKSGTTRVTFDPTTRRVVRIVAATGATRTAAGKVVQGTDVRYSYGGSGLLGFTPAGARAVVQPTVLSTATTFRTAAARAAIARMLKKNARLTRADVAVGTDEGDFRVRTFDGKIRQTGPRLDLGYDGRTLVIVDRKSGKTYRGAAKRGDVRRLAVRLGEPLLPISSAFLGRSLPFVGFLFPPRRVELGGSLPGPGGTTDILKLAARGTRATVFVRADGLVTSLESEERDQAGRVVAFGRQRFRYTTAGGNPGFPPATGSVLPLPKG